MDLIRKNSFIVKVTQYEQDILC